MNLLYLFVKKNTSEILAARAESAKETHAAPCVPHPSCLWTQQHVQRAKRNERCPAAMADLLLYLFAAVWLIYAAYGAYWERRVKTKGGRFARTHKSARARRHDVFRAGLHIQRRLLRGSLSPGQQIEIHAGPAGAHPRAGQPPWKTGDRGTHQPPGLPLFRLCGAGVPCSRHPARPAVRLCRSCAVFTAEQNAGVPVATRRARAAHISFSSLAAAHPARPCGGDIPPAGPHSACPVWQTQPQSKALSLPAKERTGP